MELSQFYLGFIDFRKNFMKLGTQRNAREADSI